MKKTQLVLKATLFCLAAALSMGVAQATTNLLYNYSFELPGTGKITTGFDTVPGWFSANPSPPTTPDSGVQPGEVPPDGTYDAFTKESDGYHARQTTSHLIQQGECYLVNIWMKNEFVHTLTWGATDGYLTMMLYYGGTANTVGTPFFTNTFLVHPGQGSHTVGTDWTNYFFGILTNSVPTAAFNQTLGVDIWQSSSVSNVNAVASQSWLDFDAPAVIGTNGISPILDPVVITPTNVVWGGETLTLTEHAFGSLPMGGYQWQTDGGGGGTLTNIDGAATNFVAVVTPTDPGTYRYQIIITNSYGTATSGVASYTVRGLLAPFVTQDIGTANFGPITNIFGFVGGNVNLYATFVGAPVVTNQWFADTGSGPAPIAGATNSLNIQPVVTGWYYETATNADGGTNSSSAHLTALADPAAPNPSVTNVWSDGYDNFANIANSYANYVVTNHPLAYWRFWETNDTLAQSMQAYDYTGNGFNATYGNTNGVPGTGCRDGGGAAVQGHHGPGYIDPGTLTPDGYWGFESNNMCAEPAYNAANGNLTAPPLNLTTNTVTFTMWIKPRAIGAALANQGLFMNRNGGDAAGISMGAVGTTNSSQMPCLVYTWNNNSSATYGWNPGLYPVYNIWQFVTLVIAPSGTKMYLYYANSTTTNLYSAANSITNATETFGGGRTWIGGYNYDNSLNFNGDIAEVAIFTNALTETQIQGMFLRAIGLTSGVGPAVSSSPPNTTVYRGQPLMMTVGAGGIPNPSFTWQGATNVTGSNGNAVGTIYLPVDGVSSGISRYITGSLTATITFSNFNNSYTWLRAIAQNPYGNATSSWASITKLLQPTNGVWTINFDVITSQNGGSNTAYGAYGVLGYKAGSSYGGTYWNALSGVQFTNTPPSKLDDGVTVSTISFGCTNSVNGNFNSPDDNNMLLEQYMNFGTNGTAMRFMGVPPGVYNLALYGTDGGPRPNYADRGTTFTVQGVSQSATNAQGSFLLPDNTVIYTGLVVTNGTLDVNMIPGWCPKFDGTNNEGDFNGAQLQLVKYGPAFSMLGKINTNTLSWVGGGLYSATNINGPWTTNPGVSPFTFNPTGYQKYFRVYNPTFPN
jgi:hypothetical protein